MDKRIGNVLEYLENSAKIYPNKIAFADEETSITYAEMVKKAQKIATFIAKRCAKETPVAVLGEKSVDTVTMFFACVYAGCFYVPLNPLHPMERRKQILQTLNNPLVLIQESCKDLYPEDMGTEKVFYYNQVNADADVVLLQQRRDSHTDVAPLYVMFTSGSTGVPKGIAVAHRSVIDFIEEFTTAFNITNQDVIGNQAPFDFDVSVKDIYSTIKTGATMQIISKKKFSMPSVLIDYLIEREVTTLIWAVSALCILSTFRAFNYKVPEKINKVLFSGETMPIKHLKIWQQNLKNAMFVNLYGPTEITCNCTYYILPQGEFTGDAIPIGKPFKNEKVFLLSEDNKLVDTPNQVGEICVSGTALSLGYYNNPTETDKAFVQNPLNHCWLEKIYKTGDLGYVNEKGEFCFTGRKDFQIKHMGHRIELSEIELKISQITGVTRALCIFDSIKDKIWAFYTGNVEAVEILTELRKHLPAYMVPHKCVQLEQFKLTENGKIDRKKLKEEYIV